MTIDEATSGNLMNMGARDAYKLIDDMTQSAAMELGERQHPSCTWNLGDRSSCEGGGTS
jgi:hypothetical protein